MALQAVAPAAPPPDVPMLLGLPVPPPAVPSVVAEATLPGDPPTRLEFATIYDSGFVTLHQGRLSYRTTLDQPRVVLRLLADRRLAPLWPALTEWAGADLVRLRDRSFARAKAAYDAGVPAHLPANMIQSTVQPTLRRTLAYTEALRAIGRHGEAMQLLRRTRDAMEPTDDDSDASYTMLTLRLAGDLDRDGDRGAAIALLADAARQAPAGSGYAINFDVNRAAYFAEAGQAAAALALVDAAQARFSSGKHERGSDRVPGSDRQFAWIRACALSRLGRADEARTAARPILTAREPHDQQFVLTPNQLIRWRFHRCTGDVAAASALLAQDFAPGVPAPGALTLLQPGLADRSDLPFRTAVAADPQLAPLLADRMRILPPELVPALNDWR